MKIRESCRAILREGGRGHGVAALDKAERQLAEVDVEPMEVMADKDYHSR